MLRISIITLAFLLPIQSVAKEASLPDIRAIETESTDVFTILTQLSRANNALASRDYIAAQEGYESVLLHDPSLVTARSGLRRALISLGQIEKAASLIDDQNSADAVLIRVLSGQSMDPVTELTNALEVKNDPRLWNSLGRIYDTAARYGSARNAYAMASLAGQRPGLVNNNIGQSFWSAGEIEKALLEFTKAVAADPTDTRFDNNRRRALVATGDIETAIVNLPSDRASIFLAQAGDQARQEGETRLAALLYRKSMDLSTRHDPHLAKRLESLGQ